MKYGANKTEKMPCDFEQIYYMAKNLISWKNLLPRIKYHMLSNPTHFLKIGVIYFGLTFLRTKYDNPNL